MMTHFVVQRLRDTFNALPDVRIASTDPDPGQIFQHHSADLVVDTWMGGRLHVYLINHEPKVRDLKATLKENTRNSIGTLFLVDAALLPAEQESFKVADWQFALFHLNDSWIYTYQLDEHGHVQVRQVHFAPTPYADYYRVWHLNDFTIEACVVRQREYDDGIRGQWFIGDLASPQYKRRINYERVHQRYHYSTRQTREVAQLPTDQLMKYYQMLGLERSASEKEVKRAFRMMALKVHPDVSALPRQESERRIKELNEAYEYIKEYHGWS
jgi:hypothetical protein